MLINVAAPMVHPFNYSLLGRLAVMCIVLHGMGKTSVAGSDSCEITRSTVQVVEDCPDSVEKWREASAKKNCTAHASLCEDPNKLVYHCVINEYVTEKLEVCAYVQNIVLGKCTSYSLSGNLIQQNSRTNCADFTKNPCPVLYRSDQAYKYPGCYQLVWKLTTVTDNPSSMNNLDAINVFTSSTLNVSSNTTQNTHGQEDVATIYIIIILVCVISILSIAITILWKNHRRKPPGVHSESEMMPLGKKENGKELKENI